MDYTAHLSADSMRFRSAIERCDPAARIVACPDWSVHDLLWHLAEVQHFWATIVGERLESPAEYDEPVRPASVVELFDFFDRSHERLRRALDSAADDDPAWTWHPPAQDVGFVKRRQAHEALIHRLDAELAAGGVTSIDAELAADGVDEMLTVILGGVPDWATVTEESTVGKVSATDTGREWFLQAGRWEGTSPTTGTEFSDEPMLIVVTGGDCEWEVSGRAADLDAWLWSRPPAGPLVDSGDVSPLVELRAHGVQ